ncbi:MAG: peptidylprolyl isomerase [Bacteroidales bacterium]|nr:peptidylprolyl isomerase [Bacteroidales bacterium]MBQ6185107.1 peptidylprolyl isomerase [Bacteroidales bacterium]
MTRKATLTLMAVVFACTMASAQKYKYIDKTVAVVGNEAIMISDIESSVKERGAQGLSSDQNVRCEVLESILESKLFLMQARIDSLTVDQSNVEAMLAQRIDQFLTYLGGEEKLEEYFGKPLYRLRQDWRKQYEDMSLTQGEQANIMKKIPDMTPHDVKEYLDTVDANNLPIVPIKYQLSQICLYPDREAADLAVREKLLELRERIINGEKFSTLARMYSEDPGSSRRGGELGMASKSIFWPVFSDAAMALKPGVISQIVETPDGFHIIEVIEKKGDMFNARHILMKPQYTAQDRDKAFKTLDSLRTEILNGAVTFKMAANFYSQDAPTKTNGGQMSDPNTGSSYFEIDQLKPEDYRAIKDLKEGEISEPVQSTDNDGRQDQEKDFVVGKTNYKIIRVDKIIPAHTASFNDDFSQLQAEVKRAKQMAAVDEFLDKKIAETRIVIDPMFKDCDFHRSGWASKFSED